MTIFSRTPPWKFTLGALLLLALWVFLLHAEAQSTQALTQPAPIPELFGVIKWLLGLCAAGIAALICAVHYGIVQRLAVIERNQELERILRRRTAAAMLTLLLMLHPDSGEVILQTFKKVIENGNGKE